MGWGWGWGGRESSQSNLAHLTPPSPHRPCSKSLEELDVKYREEAFQEIEKESKQALVDNSKLQEELAIQSIGIDKLLKKYKKAEAMLSSSKLEREMLENEVQLQVQSISRLKKRCMQSEAKLEQVKSSASEKRLVWGLFG